MRLLPLLFPLPARCQGRPYSLARLGWIGVLACGLCSAISARAENPVQVREVEGVVEYKLGNGMPVLLVPDDSSPKVTVNLTVFVGSRHEGYGEAGMAHLLEHMLFKGTPAHPNIPKVLQDRGAEFNGTTWLDRTNYYETLNATDDNLEFAIRLEADRLVNSFIRGEDLASEFSVVRSEFERGENSPQRVLMQRIQSAAYDWHNYGRSTIGNRSDIERVPILNLREFYRRHYQVDNCALIVAGKFEPARALELAEKYFGAIARPERAKNTTYTIEPAQDGERTVALRRVGDTPLVGAAYHIPSVSHDDYAVVEVLANILGTEPSGRLYKELVETKKASGVYTMTYDTHDPGLLFLLVELPKDADVEEGRKGMIEAAERIGQEGVTAEEVQRAQAEIGKGFEHESASSVGLAQSLSEWLARGDWRLRFLHRDRIEQVTPDRVKEVAAKYLVRNNRTVGLFIPTSEPQRATVPDNPDLAALLKDYKGREKIAAGEQFDPSLENIERRTARTTLPGGIKVAMLPKSTRGELVNVQIALRYGNDQALRGLVSASEVLPTLLTRGTKRLNYEQLQDELTKYHANLGANGMPGLLTLSFETKREHLLPVLELVREMLREPSLPESELEVIRQQMITGIEARKSEPTAIGSNTWRRILAPHDAADIWYVPTYEEQIERIKSLKLDDVRRLHAELLNGGNGEIAMVGDFDAAQIEPAIQAMFADWTSKVEYQRVPDPAATDIAGRTEQIVTPDKANAVFLAGLRFAMTDSHPDYAAMEIGTFIFGGGSLASRLGDRVRQQEGLSYGVGSIFSAHPIDERGQFAIQAIMNPMNRDKLVAVIREELEKLLKDGITQEELDRAKQGWLQSRQVDRTRDGELVGLLSNSLFLGRTMQHEIDLEERVAKLTVEDVNAALRRHIRPDRIVIVTAGDF